MPAEPPEDKIHWRLFLCQKREKIKKMVENKKLFICITLVLTIILYGIFNPLYAGEAILSWTPPTTNADGTTLTDLTGYKVYYGTSTGTYNSILDVGNASTTSVINLTEKVTYYFTVTAYNSVGNESSYSNEVYKTIPDLTPPVISGVSVNNTISARANITWTTDKLSSSQVEYGKTTTYGSLTSPDNTMVTSHTVTVNGLVPVTTYHFRVNSLDTNGNISNSADFTFTTPDLIPPTGTISINSSAAYTNTPAVTVYLSCTDFETVCSLMQFSKDGKTWSSWETYTSNKSYTLSNTEGSQTLYVKYKDNAGNVSGQYTANITIDTTSPTISGIASGTISTNEATISWTTNEPATSQLDYGTTASYGLSTALDANLATSHSMLINGSSPSTTYHYRVRSKDAAGNVVLSADNTFTTTTSAPPPDTTAPVISGVTISDITSADATIIWITDEAATSRIEYGTNSSYGIPGNLDSNLVTSHRVQLSGLTSNNTYYFRVHSVDQAGNNGISQGYSFTTLKITQSDTPPAPITDLRIRPGVSTKDSLFLDWTATGADGTEGIATSYDLRMSKLRIIEDGVTPKQGEINFSKASKITGIIAPTVAGSAEVFKVNKLVPNSVYFFAIKATDEKGSISAMSNVVNGNNVLPLPVTALRNGYNMISIPLAPQTSDAQALLSGIVGSPVELFWWRSNGTNDGSGSFIAETNIVPGYGYLLKSNSDNAVLTISGIAITDPSRSIPIETGWNMIGNPYTIDIPLINTYIRKIDTGELKSYEDAVIAGWVSNAIYTYNGRTYSFEMYSNASLKIWQGYWIAVLQAGQYEMVVYKP